MDQMERIELPVETAVSSGVTSHAMMMSLHYVATRPIAIIGWRFSAVVASFVVRTKLLNVEPD